MATASSPMVNHDGNWKRVIKELFSDFIAFFLPTLYQDIDWSHPPEYSDKELSQLLAQNKTKGNQEGDLLVKITLNKAGEQKVLAAHQTPPHKPRQKKAKATTTTPPKKPTVIWLLIHIEVQSYYDRKFDERMFTYYYRIWDTQQLPIMAFALFTTPFTMPTTYAYNLYKTSIRYDYETYWLKDQDPQQLLKSNNIFALVVLAALYALKTKNKAQQRFQFKKELATLLFKKGYPAIKRLAVFRFIENILALSPPTELQFKKQMTKIMEAQWQQHPSPRPDQIFFVNRLYKICHGETIEQRIEREAKELTKELTIDLQLQLQEEEKRRNAEATKRKEEEAKRKEEETKRKEEEAKRKEAEALQQQEEAKRKEEETKRKEAEALQQQMVTQLQEEEQQRNKTILSLYYTHQLTIPQIATTMGQQEEVVEQIVLNHAQKNKE